MNPCSVGITSVLTSGRLTLKRPLGVAFDCESSSSILLISEKMRRQLSRKSSPSGVNVIARGLRGNSRTPRRSSSRDMVFPTAEDDTLRRRPASVKLRVSAARTKTPKALRLSIRATSRFSAFDSGKGAILCTDIVLNARGKFGQFTGRLRLTKGVVDGLDAAVAVSRETCPRRWNTALRIRFGYTTQSRPNGLGERHPRS